MFKDTDIAWFAGLFEGEGTFMIQKKGTYAAGLAIQMTDKDVLERVASLFGGNVGIAYEAKNNWKTCYRWICSVDEADKIIKKIYPYLGERRRDKADFYMKLREPIVLKKRQEFTKKLNILLASNAGHSQRAIAEMFGVSQPYINKVLREMGKAST
ncbi:hypothetical protein SEA_BOOMERJR_129 [Streptomyces phage BoomerJR]|uniref:Homing endonuclease LAGLIDADG domain-containing protein n=2 Tax=Streptomyces virus Yaboi TaxID=2846408 RepID=A0A411C4G4_9CAUD|nr:hypothetical protein SEA_GENIE2_129 [Streptomyces phage Genie2]QAY12769.1 hypothetical protein SEA_BOOMERJR_129 [Streptomyces phage BoomerJR]UVD39963.1 hypothetical protein SEA_STANIMAL_127 [Streptomyces phage Stanimal]WNM73705.1 LAGLIDADG endonuclease [Streptomyces phage Sollertia]